MNNPGSIFLTGVTGTLGREMLRTLLVERDVKIYLLARRKTRFSHWDRVRKILAGWNMEKFLGTRIEVLEGDVTLPSFGLREHEIETLRRDVAEFYHIAALTALNGTEADCRKINIGGTDEALRMALDFRRKGVLDRFFYFSTAYVAGSKQVYTSHEDGLPEKPAFANFYESSKFASESHVRSAMKEGLPATIFRPSIVVGHSQTGEVSEFNVIYPFIRLFAHGMIKLLPSRLQNSFNIVPIDFVIKASAAIARRRDSIGHTYHLVSPEPPTVDMLMQLRRELPDVPEILLISPEDFARERLNTNEQFVYDILEPYLGYLNGGLSFDASNTQRALEGTGIAFPKTDLNFLRVLLRYAIDQKYLALQPI